ncbi:MAG TPA: 4-(cytidine 5'-diphospho)-2-C-methyl-D-erythritol kinase [Pirellulales bacterium]|nr:4-(cytidine 5'-diphospho)-2-C-methyl-D-erythritol kinase [Pirellulales bacterium]
MHVRSTAAGLEVLAPAKLNLFLEVLDKRDDGFHEIETLMVPIGLFDTLHFQDAPSGRIDLTCRTSATFGGSAEPIPAGPENIVFRAVDLVRRRFGVTKGARVRLMKRIPMAAGLAGGSSDAAAALVATCRLWELALSPGELSQLAAELGSDVPFFLGRGAAVCRGRGERIQPVSGLGNLWFVVVKPPVGLSTAEVYRACRAADRPRRVESLIEALRAGRLARAALGLHNALQPAAEKLEPWVGRLSREFAALDCLGHKMSGSGTSYFGLCRHARQARRVAACLRTRGVGRCYAVQGTN